MADTQVPCEQASGPKPRHTGALDPIALEAFLALAVERAHGVGTLRVPVAVVSLGRALIHICRGMARHKSGGRRAHQRGPPLPSPSTLTTPSRWATV